VVNFIERPEAVNRPCFLNIGVGQAAPEGCFPERRRSLTADNSWHSGRRAIEHPSPTWIARRPTVFHREQEAPVRAIADETTTVGG
jgi:hypothetical protein